jgi:hypothetical protein
MEQLLRHTGINYVTLNVFRLDGSILKMVDPMAKHQGTRGATTKIYISSMRFRDHTNSIFYVLESPHSALLVPIAEA